MMRRSSEVGPSHKIGQFRHPRLRFEQGRPRQSPHRRLRQQRPRRRIGAPDPQKLPGPPPRLRLEIAGPALGILPRRRDETLMAFVHHDPVPGEPLQGDPPLLRGKLASAEAADGGGVAVAVEGVFVALLLFAVVADVNGRAGGHVADPGAFDRRGLFVAVLGGGGDLFRLGLFGEKLRVGPRSGIFSVSLFYDTGGHDHHVCLTDLFHAISPQCVGTVNDEAF
mmetsp:Transcript_13269/g.29243  ORF Transcript_13269/g.29243 Transcript_13269/m.29243 type:complete len:224 (-) Transcript_13269:210-881(-)